jgi:GT2 family glycosyltransferase
MLDAGTEAVAMVDAQSRLEPDYLERSAAVMEETGAAVVGGAMHPVGEGVVGRAIAAALASRVGVGDSSFHFDGTARDVESVYLGVYRRSVLDTVGRYDPSLLRTEDDDMNARIRAAGWRIRLDPSIRSRYLGRQTLRGLFRQYRGYGHSKVALAAKRPGAIRLRHLVPAVLVGAIVAAALISLLAWPPALLLALLAYLGGLLVAGSLRTELPPASRFAFVAAAATMHLGYGIGTWQAILSGAWRR